MEINGELLREQYGYICDSRHVLVEYCKTIGSKDFVNENSSFGRGGSMRNLLVHIVNTYEFWIGKHALKKDIVFTPYQSVENVDEVIGLFQKVDALMSEFIEQIVNPESSEIEFELSDTKRKIKAFKLFTHVITHEFHHKGQILSISRHLGYIPVDTDIMR